MGVITLQDDLIHAAQAISMSMYACMCDATLMNHALCRQVQMLGDCIRKTIADFNKQASDLHTSFDAVCEAYEVANAAVAEGIRALGQPYLITSKIAPSIDRRGCYTVTTTPCGYEAEVNTEQV